MKLDCADLTALILAGGQGTRLRAAVPDRPKVLAPVLGRPFIAYVLNLLDAAGVRRALFLTGYGADDVQTTIGARYRGLELSYLREPEPLGTGGALRQALDRRDQARFLVLNGDSYCGVDLGKLAAFHRRSQGEMSMVVTRVPDTSRFGQVQYATLGRNRISGFIEKGSAAGSGWINAGIYVVERPLLTKITRGQNSSLERDWLPRWLKTQTLLAYPTRAPLCDIGTPESYKAAAIFFAQLPPGGAPHAVPA
jgi:D-glycero-alpha-D-manno-heptose 1-phosphate guanylyltransferase